MSPIDPTNRISPGLTFPLEPMRAVSGVLPRADEDARWAYEVKWDGMRIVAWIGAGGVVRLQSAMPREVTATFPELAGLAAATGGRRAVLDGEIVALDDGGRPSFGMLQHRMHVLAPAEVARRAAAVPVAYQVFDLLSFDGTDAISLTYEDRRRLLEQLIEPGAQWSVPASHRQGGRVLLDRVTELGLEGLVAKRLDSTYQPGRRSPAWRKVKVRTHQEFVVGGWSPGEGRRSGRLAALLVGAHRDGALRFAGRVGTGFSDAELTRLDGLLRPLARPDAPFAQVPADIGRRPAFWVEPTVVVEVAYGEITADGILRHPAYIGQRTDKDAASVTFAP